MGKPNTREKERKGEEKQWSFEKKVLSEYIDEDIEYKIK